MGGVTVNTNQTTFVPLVIALVSYSVVLGCTAVFFANRVRRGVRLKSLAKVVYSLLFAYLLLRVAWCLVQLVIPVGNTASEAVMRTSFMLTRLSLIVFLNIYTVVCLYWINSVHSLMEMGKTLNHAVQINFDYERLSKRGRFVLCVATGLVTSFTFAVMITLAATGDPSIMRWLSPPVPVNMISSSSSSDSLSQAFGNYTGTKSKISETVRHPIFSTENCNFICCKTNVAAAPVQILVGGTNYATSKCGIVKEFDVTLMVTTTIMTQGLMLVYSLAFLSYGMWFFFKIKNRSYWSWWQKLRVAAIPVLLSLCFVSRMVFTFLSVLEILCVFWIYVCLALLPSEVIPSLVFLFSVSNESPFFFFWGSMFDQRDSFHAAELEDANVDVDDNNVGLGYVEDDDQVVVRYPSFTGYASEEEQPLYQGAPQLAQTTPVQQ
eukprot:TRINITY_DN2991_c0_g1_i1.p1 TRINITY_DN2991_c0_g1~~TRINITY_DN2991_c0_g1_i1.p1  ORF type:complete len:445 (+),score=94.71 TRINITY_DN2991_c0_g1_i1:31-1335(+)